MKEEILRFNLPIPVVIFIVVLLGSRIVDWAFISGIIKVEASIALASTALSSWSGKSEDVALGRFWTNVELAAG